MNERSGYFGLVGADILPDLIGELNTRIRQVRVRFERQNDSIANHSRNYRAREVCFDLIQPKPSSLSLRILSFRPKGAEEFVTVANDYAVKRSRSVRVCLADNCGECNRHRALIARELLDDFANAR